MTQRQVTAVKGDYFYNIGDKKILTAKEEFIKDLCFEYEKLMGIYETIGGDSVREKLENLAFRLSNFGIIADPDDPDNHEVEKWLLKHGYV